MVDEKGRVVDGDQLMATIAASWARQGRLAGTLCHFDLEDHDVADEEYLLLDRAARLLPAFLAPV